MRVGEMEATAFATHLFFLALLGYTLLFLSLFLFALSEPPAVSFETLDCRVALAEKRFELKAGSFCRGEPSLKGRLGKGRI
jgi:hypothetical protein